jgi:site-specific recombinase XerC
MPVTRELVLLAPRVKEFLVYCGACNFSANTIRAYGRDLADFIVLSGGSETTTGQINRKLIRSFYSLLYESGVKLASVRRKLAAVKSFCPKDKIRDVTSSVLGSAKKYGLLVTNPADGTSPTAGQAWPQKQAVC